MKIRMALISALALTLIGCNENSDSADDQAKSSSSDGPMAVQMELTEAEKNYLTFTRPEDEPKAPICPSPNKPEPFANLVRGKMLTRIYERINYERIAETGVCSCELLHPSYDEAMVEFGKWNYFTDENMKAWGKHRDESYDRKMAVADQVKALCDAAGVEE